MSFHFRDMPGYSALHQISRQSVDVRDSDGYFELILAVFSFFGHLQVRKLISSISDFLHNVRL